MPNVPEHRIQCRRQPHPLPLPADPRNIAHLPPRQIPLAVTNPIRLPPHLPRNLRTLPGAQSHHPPRLPAHHSRRRQLLPERPRKRLVRTISGLNSHRQNIAAHARIASPGIPSPRQTPASDDTSPPGRLRHTLQRQLIVKMPLNKPHRFARCCFIHPHAPQNTQPSRPPLARISHKPAISGRNCR